MLKDGKKACAVCGFVFAPKNGGQVCCNGVCSAAREKERHENKRRAITPHLAGIVRAEELTEKLTEVPVPVTPLPPPSGYAPHWVLNPMRGKAGEPLYVWDDGHGGLIRPGAVGLEAARSVTSMTE